MPIRRWYYLCLVMLLLFAWNLYTGCDHRNSRKEAPGGDPAEVMLVRQYCGSCHLPVSPALLDKDTWMEHVLPAMAPKLGIKVWNGHQYYAGDSSNAVIPYADWMKIVRYYRQSAPEKLAPAKVPVPLQQDRAVFRIRKPQWKDTAGIAVTTMTVIDTAGHTLFSCDAANSNLYRWDKDLRPVLFRHLPSPAVNAAFAADVSGGGLMTLTCIGIMRAVDYPAGKIVRLDLRRKEDTAETIASGLPRPVQAIPADLNKDGLTDWVVCGFGHNDGGLYALMQTPDHRYRKMSIREVPGAEQAVTGDFNRDGWPDIMALFAHADEGIWLFLNNRRGGFTASNLLRFPPVYGSTSFQLADLNRDGLQDIIYTCGDNADYSKVLKPFHGIYIFLNQGGFRYRQTYFYPVNGCTKATAADFDGDGDLDIASIAFFADLQHRPAEKFIYFEQDAPMHFIPHAVPVQNYGRWICMDVNDLDGDGDPDIVLGNYSRGFINQPGFKPDWNTHLPLIVLENITTGLATDTGKQHQ